MSDQAQGLARLLEHLLKVECLVEAATQGDVGFALDEETRELMRKEPGPVGAIFQTKKAIIALMQQQLGETSSVSVAPLKAGIVQMRLWTHTNFFFGLLLQEQYNLFLQEAREVVRMW